MDPLKKPVSGARQIRTLESDVKAYEQSQSGAPVPAGPEEPQKFFTGSTPIATEMPRASLSAEPREVRMTSENPFISEMGTNEGEKAPGAADPFKADRMTASVGEETAPKRVQISPIHTFTSDVADVVKNEDVSLATMVTSQTIVERERAAEEKEDRSHAIRTTLIVLGILVFLAAGGGLIYYFFFVYKTVTVVPVVAVQPSFFTPDSTQSISLSSESDPAFSSKAASAIAQAAGSQKVVRLAFMDGSSGAPVDSDGLFALLQASAPDILPRALDPEFFLGAYGTGASAKPFLIFRTSSFSSADAGMLAWENTMVKDLQSIFLAPADRLLAPVFVRNAAGGTYSFRSAVISNKDVRAAEDASGRIFLLYSFIDSRTLVVAPDPTTLQAAIDRLTQAQIVR